MFRRDIDTDVPSWRLRACLLAAILILSAPGTVHAETTIKGRASVIDGDTIEIRGDRIRFNGIDAPEASQMCLDRLKRDYKCGAQSANELANFLAASTPTSCEFVGRDRYGRFVGNCFRADGKSVSEWMVENGFAFDWPRYSLGAYSDIQAKARAEHKGMWSGSFDLPWDWRRKATSPTASVSALSRADRACDIKANINSKGLRIYHSPGQRDYDKTHIDEGKGERWFCSAEEARAAGWHPAKR